MLLLLLLVLLLRLTHDVPLSYTDRAGDVDANNCLDVLVLANRFGVPRLRALTEKHIRAHISPANAVSILLAASMHEASALRKCAKQFVLRNFRAVRDGEGFAKLKHAPDLLIEILDAIAVDS